MCRIRLELPLGRDNNRLSSRESARYATQTGLLTYAPALEAGQKRDSTTCNRLRWESGTKAELERWCWAREQGRTGAVQKTADKSAVYGNELIAREKL